jgi:UDP-glucose 4-epimerase
MNALNYYQGKNVLITGGGGFIGSNLASKLVELGAEVTIMDSKLPGHGFNEFNLAHLKDRVILDFADIRDSEAAKRNVQGKDIIFNLAAQVGEKNSISNPSLDRQINIEGHCKVLDIVSRFNPSARLIFTGSRLEYGKTTEKMPISEDHPLNPMTPYAINKALGEQLYLRANREEGLQTIAVRIANPYGPRASINNPGYCIVNWFVGRALRGENLPVYGEGSQKRDYIFIDDLVEAMTRLAVCPRAVGNVYNIGSGEGVAFKTMASSIVDIVGGESKVTHIPWPDEAKDRETGDFIANITRLREVTNWTPRFSLTDGLKKTAEFYRNNLIHYK